MPIIINNTDSINECITTMILTLELLFKFNYIVMLTLLILKE